MFDPTQRAFAIRDELGPLPAERRGELMLELVGALAAEAALVLGRRKVSEDLYSLADTCVGETRLREGGGHG